MSAELTLYVEHLRFDDKLLLSAGVYLENQAFNRYGS